MIPVEEARERILSRVPVLGAERVELRSGLDRVLAEDIVASRDIPPWPNSSMDGYALRSADTQAASAATPARLVLAGRVAAGAVAEQPLCAGEAFRIFTGAPLPEGADSVIPQEEVSEDGGVVVVERPVRVGEFVIPYGVNPIMAPRQRFHDASPALQGNVVLRGRPAHQDSNF